MIKISFGRMTEQEADRTRHREPERERVADSHVCEIIFARSPHNTGNKIQGCHEHQTQCPGNGSSEFHIKKLLNKLD